MLLCKGLLSVSKRNHGSAFEKQKASISPTRNILLVSVNLSRESKFVFLAICWVKEDWKC